MRIYTDSYERMAERLAAQNGKIMIYGAGTMGRTLVPYLFERYRIAPARVCYVDGDAGKQGDRIRLGEVMAPVMAPAVLEKESGPFSLLLAYSAFEPLLETLKKQAYMKQADVYLLPLMQLRYNASHWQAIDFYPGGEEKIPKIIHYCWFSGAPLPERLHRCIASWRRFCPAYEIRRWDESNYDFRRNPYMRDAYAHGKWGLVSDVARLDLLYRYGGIYLDTDVELLRSPDPLLVNEAFVGTECWGVVNSGGGLGAVAGHPVIETLLRERENEPFVRRDGTLNTLTGGAYETVPLMRRGLRVDGSLQNIDGLTVYPPDVFHPYDAATGEERITANTFAIHHFDGSWVEDRGKKEREKTRRFYQEGQWKN